MEKRLISLIAILSLVGVASAQMVGYWSFDEGVGATAADTVGGNTGYLVAGAYSGGLTGYWTPGVSGSAYNFDGKGTCNVPVAAVSTITNKATVAFRAKGTATSVR